MMCGRSGDGSILYKDIWRSKDGVSWDQMPDLPFSARQLPHVEVLDE